MVSKTTLNRLSLGAVGAIWLALSSVESVNAASFKGSSFNIAQPQLVSAGIGNGKTGATSSQGAAKFLITTGSFLAIVLQAGDPVFQLLEELFGDEDQPVTFNNGPSAGQPLKLDDFKIPTGRYVPSKIKPPVPGLSNNPNPGEPNGPSPGVKPSPRPTPVPTPALLPALIGLGLKMKQKSRLERSGVLEEA